jgi:hypothetical protein
MTAADATSSRYAAVVALVAVALLGLFAVWQRFPLGWIAVVIGIVGAVRLLRQQRGAAAETRDGQRW